MAAVFGSVMGRFLSWARKRSDRTKNASIVNIMLTTGMTPTRGEALGLLGRCTGSVGRYASTALGRGWIDDSSSCCY